MSKVQYKRNFEVAKKMRMCFGGSVVRHKPKYFTGFTFGVHKVNELCHPFYKHKYTEQLLGYCKAIPWRWFQTINKYSYNAAEISVTSLTELYYFLIEKV